jgi:hypothetical protein
VANGTNFFDTTDVNSTGDVGSGPPGVPLTIFNTERWDSGASGDLPADELQYSFPVAAGATVEVRIYVAEIYNGITAAGGRVFDVAVDGSVPAAFDDIDPYALGGNAASVGSVVTASVVSDGSIDLVFLHQAENPNPKAIEIVVTEPGPADLDGPAVHDFGSVSSGDSATDPITLVNPIGSDGPVEITGLAVNGDPEFTLVSPPGLPVSLNPGDTLTLNVQFSPTSGGPFSGTLDATHDGESGSLSVALSGDGVEPSPVLYRVNAGGPELTSLDSGPNWAADTEAAPSPLHNSGSSVGAFPNDNGVDASVPASTPTSGSATGSPNVFVTERWDNAGGTEMEWDFPVTSGEWVEVRLYFHNGYDLTSELDERQFDVNLEGTTVLNDFDISDEVGHRVGTMRSFVVQSDGNIDINFFHGPMENPLINAIEILTVDGNSSTVSASPTAVDFGDVDGMTFADEVVTITHPGAPGAPAVTITDLSITGADASDFTVIDGGPITLSPGGELQVTLRFAPGAAGARSASLDVTHDGTGSPLNVPLSGTGTADIVPLFVNAGNVAPPTGWVADTPYRSGGNFFNTGETIDLTHPSVPAGTPEAVFQSETWGPQTWSFPLVDGDYEVRLYFAEIFQDADNARQFNVAIEGTPVLTNYDQWEEAGGADFTGVVETFLVSVDDGDGLTVDITNGAADNAAIKGVSIRPIEFAVNAGAGGVAGTPWTDASGFVDGGTAFPTSDPITLDPSAPFNTPQSVFQNELYGDTSWAFNVANGDYEVQLFLCETFQTQAGMRTFDVSIQGGQVLNDYDMFAAYGHDVGFVLRFPVTVSDGVLNVDFTTVIDNASVKGIVIVAN